MSIVLKELTQFCRDTQQWLNVHSLEGVCVRGSVGKGGEGWGRVGKGGVGVIGNELTGNEWRNECDKE